MNGSRRSFDPSGMRRKILVIHGPNLNLLGLREPEQYGTLTLEEVNRRIESFAREKGVEVEIFQTNHEGEMVERIHGAMGIFDAIVINPAAFTHTSVALRDALLATAIPAVEVHISNIHKREPFRRRSLISDVVVGQVSGFGPDSYILGLMAAILMMERRDEG